MTAWEILILLGVGGGGGFFIGQRWAEFARARFDMKRTWENRRAYRE